MITKADITLIRSLADKRNRSEHGLFVVEGRKMVGELLKSNWKAEQIFTTSQQPFDERFTPVSPKEMERISMLKTPSDHLAIVRIPKINVDFGSLENSLTLALDDVQDPGNVGTIIRIADWFGIRNILCSSATADCYNPKVVQATMGALFRINLHYVDLPGTLAKINAPVYGTLLEGEDIYKQSLSSNGVVVMGNEGNGISSAVAKTINHKLYIPPFPIGQPSSESLNVATATAIICSEFRRRP